MRRAFKAATALTAGGLCGMVTLAHISRNRIPDGMDLAAKETVKLSRHDGDMLHMEVFPSTTTIDFYEIEGENTEVPVQYLEERVRRIVAANPWLAGRLVVKDGVTMIAYDAVEGKDAWVDVVGLKVFQTIEGSACELGLQTAYFKLPSILEANTAAVGKGISIVGKDEPVFRVSVISDVAGSACEEMDGVKMDGGIKNKKKRFAVVTSMPHCIGDGYTFYSIRNMLSCEEDIRSLDNSRCPSTDDKIASAVKDAEPLKPVLVNLMFHDLKTALWKANDMSVLRLDVDDGWIKREKEAYLAELSSSSSSCSGDGKDRPAFISTNDILARWFFKFSSPMLGLMAINMRGKVPGVSHNLAGNYAREIPFCRRDYESPALIRKAVEGLHRAASPPTPIPTIREAFGTGVSLMTNWCAFSKEVKLEGAKIIMHLPVYDWYRQERLNEVSHIAVVYRPRAGQTSILLAVPKNELELYAEAALGLIEWSCVGSFTNLL